MRKLSMDFGMRALLAAILCLWFGFGPVIAQEQKFVDPPLARFGILIKLRPAWGILIDSNAAENQKNWKEAQSQLRGMKLSQDEPLVIDTVYPGGPASAAGLMPGDEIIAIDGRPVKNMLRDEAILWIRGDKGHFGSGDVTLTVATNVARNGKHVTADTREVTLKRVLYHVKGYEFGCPLARDLTAEQVPYATSKILVNTLWLGACFV